MGAILDCDSFHLLIYQYEGFSNWSLFKWRYDPPSGNSIEAIANKADKNFRTSTGFELMLALQCYTNWVMKTPTLRAGQFAESQCLHLNLYLRSSHHLHSIFHSFQGVKMNSTNWPSSNVWVFIAHCSATAEAMGSKSRFFFFQHFKNCIPQFT